MLLGLVSKNPGGVGHNKSFLGSMTTSTDLSVMEDGLSQMQGVAIVQDARRGVFVNVIKTS